MTPQVIAAIITSAMSLIAATFAALLAISGQRKLKLLEAESKHREDSAEFLASKLDRLYLPVSMNLSATVKLFARFKNTEDENEKTAIEHELRNHNAKIRECLLNSSIYLEPDAPDGMIEKLLEHLLQWDIVYRLKYEYKVYDGPVFAGIERFGFRGFPRDQDVDGYFSRTMRELKNKHHARLRES